ncbi:hypothetical protein [Altericroceibacterium endophyticum]|uniref:Uncharacterized protein n=1 Tax=Altericroceibacterium endophyticum TaxID=1808508 RepID=A0A6I4T1W9_9SPHN|nr:hypothetical protein [Altericroceibacterium endophyticum]MXO64957.1 hypothetical protein [Altericroceibacterium endophyticum]
MPLDIAQTSSEADFPVKIEASSGLHMAGGKSIASEVDAADALIAMVASGTWQDPFERGGFHII